MPAGSSILLVCIPGTLGTSRTFAGLLRRLRRFGLNVRPWYLETGGWQSAQLAATAAASEIALAAGERLVIVGFSLGGIIAVQVALRCPERVSGLVLIDMNGEADVPENAARRRAALARARTTGIAAYIREEMWPTHVAAARRGDVALLAELVAMGEACGIEAFANQTEIANSRPRTLDVAPGLTVPTLVVCGAEDLVTPPAMSHALAAAIPAANLEIIEGAGHYSILEAPDTIAAAMAQWLSGITAEPGIASASSAPSRAGKSESR